MRSFIDMSCNSQQEGYPLPIQGRQGRGHQRLGYWRRWNVGRRRATTHHPGPPRIRKPGSAGHSCQQRAGIRCQTARDPIICGFPPVGDGSAAGRTCQAAHADICCHILYETDSTLGEPGYGTGPYINHGSGRLHSLSYLSLGTCATATSLTWANLRGSSLLGHGKQIMSIGMTGYNCIGLAQEKSVSFCSFRSVPAQLSSRRCAGLVSMRLRFSCWFAVFQLKQIG